MKLFDTLCTGLCNVIGWGRNVLAILPTLALSACLAPEPVGNGGGQSQAQVVNVYNDDTAGGGETGDADTDTDSDSDSGGDTGETGDTAEPPTYTYYGDVDGDGYGDPASSVTDTEAPEGYVADNTDCDDTLASVHPGADEYCNGIDDDCDGVIDEDPVDGATWFTDADGDGFGDPATSVMACTAPLGTVADATDCDDTDPDVYPGATEIPDDGIDQDCDGSDLQTWWADTDGDGYGDPASSSESNTVPPGMVANDDDCDDTNSDVHPGATEIPDNGVDEDCDGSDLTTYYADGDGDGYGDPDTSTESNTAPSGYVVNNTDCDDMDASVNPGESEVPVNGIDDNCSGDDSALLVSAFHGETTVEGDSIAANYDEYVWYGASEEGVQNVSYSSSDLPTMSDSNDVVEITVYYEDFVSLYGGHPWVETNLVWDSNGDAVEETWLDEGCEGWSFTVTATEASTSVGTAYAYNWTDGFGDGTGNCSLYLEGNLPSGSDVGQVFEFSVP